MLSGSENNLINQECYRALLLGTEYFQHTSYRSQEDVAEISDFISYIEEEYNNNCDVSAIQTCLSIAEDFEYSHPIYRRNDYISCISYFLNSNQETVNDLSALELEFLYLLREDMERFGFPYYSFIYYCRFHDDYTDIQQASLPILFPFFNSYTEYECSQHSFAEDSHTEVPDWDRYAFCSSENSWIRRIINIDGISSPIIYHTIALENTTEEYERENAEFRTTIERAMMMIRISIGEDTMNQVLQPRSPRQYLPFYVIRDGEENSSGAQECFRNSLGAGGEYTGNRILLRNCDYSTITHEFGHAIRQNLFNDREFIYRLSALFNWCYHSGLDYLPIASCDCQREIERRGKTALYASENVEEFFAVLFENYTAYKTGLLDENYFNTPGRRALLGIMENLFSINGNINTSALTEENIQSVYVAEGLNNFRFRSFPRFQFDIRVSSATVASAGSVFLNLAWVKQHVSYGFGLEVGGISLGNSDAALLSAELYIRLHLTSWLHLEGNISGGVIFNSAMAEPSITAGARAILGLPFLILVFPFFHFGFSQEITFWNDYHPTFIEFGLGITFNT